MSFRLIQANADYSQPNGAEKAIDILGDVTEKEKKLLAKALDGLKGNIEKGVTFANASPK